MRGSEENVLIRAKPKKMKERVSQSAWQYQGRLHRGGDFSPLLDRKLLKAKDHVFLNFYIICFSQHSVRCPESAR